MLGDAFFREYPLARFCFNSPHAQEQRGLFMATSRGDGIWLERA